MCFFRSGHVDKTRYTVLGSTDRANLDDESGVWPTSYAAADLSPQAEDEVTDQVQQAVSS